MEKLVRVAALAAALSASAAIGAIVQFRVLVNQDAEIAELEAQNHRLRVEENRLYWESRPFPEVINLTEDDLGTVCLSHGDFGTICFNAWDVANHKQTCVPKMADSGLRTPFKDPDL